MIEMRRLKNVLIFIQVYEIKHIKQKILSMII